MLRVLNVKADQTFFLVVSIMDRYFLAKSLEGCCLKKEDLHLIGLVAVYIGSKFEDVHPISMENILVDASHGKYSILEIIR